LDTVANVGQEEASLEETLEMLQRVFRQADLATKRAFVSWVGEYVQLHADQGLWREEY